MSWKDILKMVGNEDDYIPEAMRELLEENESLQDKYVSFMDELNYEVNQLGEKMAKIAEEDNLDDYATKAIDKYINMNVTGDEHFEEVYEAVSDEYYTRKRDAGEEEDSAPQLEYGNKNQKTFEDLENFQGQYYENEWTDYRTNRELSALMAAVSRGDTDNLEEEFPEAYLIFDEAGLLSDLE